MTINGIETSGSSHQPDRLQQAQRSDAPETAGSTREDQRAPGQDKVEISQAARELARLAETQSAPAPGGPSLDAEHMRTIMTRLADGFYDSPEVQLEIANRIQSAGPDSASGVNPL